MYVLISPEQPDEKLLEEYSKFCSSVQDSNYVVQQRYQITNQYINLMHQSAQQDSMYANQYSLNVQQDIFRRQNQISQSIQQRGAIINSTYQNRVAAQDRMRQKTSEAIRGVDTYQTSNGPVEFKTGAKRVIQNSDAPIS